VKRRIERTLLHLQRVARDLLDALGDRPSVERPQVEDAQDEEVQRALDEVGWLHTPRLSTRDAASSSEGAIDDIRSRNIDSVLPSARENVDLKVFG
jgi:hypothetical protein